MDLIRELQGFAVKVEIHDPFASAEEVANKHKIQLIDKIGNGYDAVIVAVSHREYQNLDADYFRSIMNEHPILFDIKGIYPKDPENLLYWRL